MNRSEAATLELFQEQGRQLETERVHGIMQLVTRLQAEGKSVVEQKLALLDIKEQASFEASLGEHQTSVISAEKLRETIEANKEQVKRSLDYLRQNNEEVEQKVQSDPI